MTTRSDPGELRNFQLGSLLGEGADLQAFAARNSESGERVVVKRPHPSLVSRNMHRDVERRIALQAQVRETLGHPGSLARLHALTEPDAFAWYFGDEPAPPLLRPGRRTRARRPAGRKRSRRGPRPPRRAPAQPVRPALLHRIPRAGQTQPRVRRARRHGELPPTRLPGARPRPPERLLLPRLGRRHAG